MTADATIDYDSLQVEALRGLVRSVLARVAKSGLPGDHHLYISFDVRAPDVILSKRLREKYPSEMTIVLQHRFWDLAVTDERFEVKLTFDGIPERLVIPFAAIRVFLDPSVPFVLRFEDLMPGEEDGSNDAGADPRTAGKPARKPRTTRARTRTEASAGGPLDPSAPAQAPAPPSAVSPPAPSPLAKPKLSPAFAASRNEEAVEAADAKSGAQEAERPVAPTPGMGQVVSLDAFRKK